MHFANCMICMICSFFGMMFKSNGQNIERSNLKEKGKVPEYEKRKSNLILFSGLFLQSPWKIIPDLNVLPPIVGQVGRDLLRLELLSQSPVLVDQPVGPQPGDVARCGQPDRRVRHG